MSKKSKEFLAGNIGQQSNIPLCICVVSLSSLFIQGSLVKKTREVVCIEVMNNGAQRS